MEFRVTSTGLPYPYIASLFVKTARKSCHQHHHRLLARLLASNDFFVLGHNCNKNVRAGLALVMYCYTAGEAGLAWGLGQGFYVGGVA